MLPGKKSRVEGVGFSPLEHGGLPDDCVRELCSKVGFEYEPDKHPRKEWDGRVEVYRKDRRGVHLEGVDIIYGVYGTQLLMQFNRDRERVLQDETRELDSSYRDPRIGCSAIRWTRKV